MAVPIPTKFKIEAYVTLDDTDPNRRYLANLFLPQEHRELVTQPDGHKKWEHTGWRWTMCIGFHGVTEDVARAKAQVFTADEIVRLHVVRDNLEKKGKKTK